MNGHNVVSLNRVILEMGKLEAASGSDALGTNLADIIAHYLCGAAGVDPEESPDDYRFVYGAVLYLMNNGLNDITSPKDEDNDQMARLCTTAGFVPRNATRARLNSATRARLWESTLMTTCLSSYVSLIQAAIGDIPNGPESD